MDGSDSFGSIREAKISGRGLLGLALPSLAVLGSESQICSSTPGFCKPSRPKPDSLC